MECQLFLKNQKSDKFISLFLLLFNDLRSPERFFHLNV